MNKNLIYQAIQNPETLVNLATDDLERLTKDHPWFSAAHVLLAKKYQLNADYRFTDQLHTAAMLSGNRTVLYRYLHPREELKPEQPSVASLENVKQSISQELQVEKAEELDDLLEQQEAFFDIFTEQKIPSAPIVGLDFEEEKQTPLENSAPLGTLAERILAEENEEAKREHEVHLREPEHDPLPDQLHTSTEQVEEDVVFQETEASLQESPQKEEERKTFDDLDREILVNALHKSIEIEVSEPEVDEDEVREEPLQRLPQALDAEAPLSASDPYTAWLLRRSREIHYVDSGDREIEQTEEKEANQPLEEGKPSETEVTQGVSHGVERLQAPDKTRHQRDLIDRFIQQEPKISQGKASDYTGVSFGKESLEDSLGLVTETMAKLYAAQGKLDKARKAYKRLIELHPEKSVYFATQLKNLNTKK